MRIRMRQWIWLLAAVLLTGCSKSNRPQQVENSQPAVKIAQAAPPPGANPEPVAAKPESDPEPIAEDEGAPPSPERQLLIPRGTRLHVRIDETLNTRRDRPGHGFFASIYEPVLVNGRTVIPAGTPCRGHLTESKPSGRFRGRAVLGLTLDSIRLRGRDYDIRTSGVYRASGNHKRRNIGIIGGVAGLGAVIGAIAGGGKGAAVGALAGGGAGAVGAAATGRKQVGVPAEATLTFALREPLRMRL
jgi:hypothetical protein